MNINSLDNYAFSKTISLLSKNNPFKKGTLQYYLVFFVIQNYESLSKYTNDSNNKKLLKFLSTKKETFFIEPWNGFKLFESAISLSIIHNIIKISKPSSTHCFGLFAEDGLMNILKEPQFIDQLKKRPMTENIKLLFLSIYMNEKVKIKNHVPQIKFNKPNFSYGEKDFTISLSDLPYHKIFDFSLEIPLLAFSNCWHDEDWTGLNSRGIFHHVGDHVGFFYGAKSVGECYFLGKDQTNHLVTLSSPHKFSEKSSSMEKSSYHTIFSHLHPTDFTYIYGVPKGNPFLFDNPMLTNSIEEDCQQNDTRNVIAAEHFWNNPVFMRNTQRKMFVGSIEDKLKDILLNIKHILSEEQYLIAQKIINDEPISKKELINNSLTIETFPAHKMEEITKQSSFFIKSLAHKTVCEIINPIENLELGFFMKNNGSIPKFKTLFIFDLLLSSFKLKQRVIKKPLFHMKEKFISLFLKENKDFISVWSKESKKGFLFSDIISMRNEYRIFIVNNKVVATTACFRNTVPLNAWQNGRFDPRLVNGHNDQVTHINRQRVAKYAKFARQYCREMQAENPQCHSYVLDVAWCDEKSTVVPIEINSITWSGAYQVNMHRVCAEMVKQAFNYSNIYLFLREKCDTWLELIKEKVIDTSMFDLCGLERTLKGKTLPSLEAILKQTNELIKNFSVDLNNENSVSLFSPHTNIKEDYQTSLIEELKIINALAQDKYENYDEDEDEDNQNIDEGSKEK